jgi:cobalamin biosynthesis protein CbiG
VSQAVRELPDPSQPDLLVLGVGCRIGAKPDEIVDLARDVLAEAGLAWGNIEVVATVEHRLGHPAVEALAHYAGARLVGYTAERLASVADIPNPSAFVAEQVGAAGVAEPAAMLASDGGTLVVTKRRSANATLAVARRVGGQRPGQRSTIG